MDYNKTWFLYQSDRAHVRDFRCAAPRAHRGTETTAALDHLLFTRRGVFTKHLGRWRGTVVTAEPTHVVLYNRGEIFHTSHPGEQGDSGTVLGFTADVMREVATELRLGSDEAAVVRFPTSHALATPSMLLRVFRLRDRLKQGLATDLEAEEELLHILADVMRQARASTARRSYPLNELSRRKRREQVETVRQLLAATPHQPASLASLAERLDASPFHLTRVFREETGLPIHQYHRRLRVMAALDRLAESNATLSRIGLELGFSSHSHFTAAFRRVFGVAPSRVCTRRRG
jgi:AraC-like DNA-binding protein